LKWSCGSTERRKQEMRWAGLRGEEEGGAQCESVILVTVTGEMDLRDPAMGGGVSLGEESSSSFFVQWIASERRDVWWKSRSSKPKCHQCWVKVTQMITGKSQDRNGSPGVSGHDGVTWMSIWCGNSHRRTWSVCTEYSPRQMLSDG
jgi:hypothetical protein